MLDWWVPLWALHAFIPAWMGWIAASNALRGYEEFPSQEFTPEGRKIEARSALQLWGICLGLFFVWPVVIPCAVVWFVGRTIFRFVKVLRHGEY